MSPLFIVGIIFVSTALADVKHVLEGSAHAPSPHEINNLAHAKNAFQSGNPNDFWWMADNSPLKEAYDHYKKCSLKGNCSPEVAAQGEILKDFAQGQFGPIDVNKNPFLSGNFNSAKSKSGFHAGASLDLSKNPFLKGQFVTSGNGEQIRNENGFLGVQPSVPFGKKKPFSHIQPQSFSQVLPPTNPAFDGNKGHDFILDNNEANKCKGEGYVCVEKGLCQNGVVSANGEDILQTRNRDTTKCKSNEICCRLNGQVSKIAANINSLSDISFGKSSVPGSTIKFSGGAGLSPGQIQVLPEDPKAEIYLIGESGSHSGVSTSKPPRDTSNSPYGSSTVDYSDTKFNDDVRFASTIRGPAYLPPIGGPTPSTRIPDISPPISTYQPSIPTSTYRPPSSSVYLPPSTTQSPIKTPSINNQYISCPPGTRKDASGQCVCPPGSRKGPSGNCEFIQTSTTARPCPSGARPSPSGGCEYLPPATTPKSCPPGARLTTFGKCEYEPQPTTPKSCPPGSRLTPSGNCEYPPPPTTQRTCPPGSRLGPFGSCEYPTTQRPFPTSPSTVNRDYLPPSTPRSCPPGARLSPSGSCEYPPPPPTQKTCPPGSRLSPSGNCEYPPPPPTQKTCPPGSRLSPSGNCEYPPPPPTQKTCPPGSRLSSSGNCEYPPPPPTQKTCPPGSRLSPSGNCEYPPPPPTQKTCPPGSRLSPSGNCEYPSPPPTQKTCPPGSRLTPSGNCERPQTCPPGQKLSPSGGCEYPPTPRPFPSSPSSVSRDYLPPSTPRPTSPRPTTQNPTEGYVYNKNPTPPFTYPPSGSDIYKQSVPPPTSNSYLPPVTGEDIQSELIDNTEEGTGNNPSVISTTRRPPPTPPRPPFNQPPIDENNQPPVGCAAALKCVQEIYCTADGFVSPVPVVLTKEQEITRVPTTVCQDIESGIIGKCCRDPNYKDPWPSANLVNGVDDGQYKEDSSLGQYSPEIQRSVRSDSVATRSISRNNNVNQARDSDNNQQCGQRNANTTPLGSGPIDANFAEFPWQAMILRDSNRSLLCGGAIIRRDAVLTAAHCVEGLETSDILIKGGEWKLGIDEEPLPFQIVKVSAIIRHPEYKVGSLQNDLAVLVLQEKLRESKNIGTICLPEPNQIPTQDCVATGWGKRILQLHAKNALMHRIDVKIMDSKQCEETLNQRFKHAVGNYSPNTLCGYSNIDQCKVDYGSALACSNGSGIYTLSGIYAWDTGCKEEGQIGGYVAPDVEWIESTLAKPHKELLRLDRQYALNSNNN